MPRAPIFGDCRLDKVDLLAYHRKQRKHFRQFALSLGSKYMAVFSAYFDASGTHSGSLITVNMGFIASWKKWEKFNRNWQRILDSRGIKVFHATDFFTGNKEFKGWKESEKWPFVEALIYTLKGLHPIAYLVRTDEFKAVQAHYTDPRIMDYSPYKLCFDRSLLNVEGWAIREKGRDEISIFFEDGPDKHNTEVLALYEKLMKSPLWKLQHKITSIGFIKKESSKGLPFQPADLVAWAFHRYHTDRIKYPKQGIKETLAKKSVIAISGMMPKYGEGYLFTPAQIKEFFDMVISE